MTYDREVLKIDEKRLAAAHAKLYLPPPIYQTLVPTSQQDAAELAVHAQKPGDGWFAADFDDKSWKNGPGGFGTQDTPGTVVRHRMERPRHLDSPRVRTFSRATPAGRRTRTLRSTTTKTPRSISTASWPQRWAATPPTTFRPASRQAAMAALHAGRNMIAVHCKQTGGGQYIDVGIVGVKER